ncbi:MAG: ABC transporter ATP-binding protein [Nitrospinota bacterium]|nr:MAG: ABC transporter ATP-binding protein [Nitrospinota bacterium]
MDLLLSVRNLKTYFYTYRGVVKALDGVYLDLAQESTLGLVGETGCGKSVTSLSILRLIEPPGKIVGGEIWFAGRDLLTLSPQEMRRIRGAEIAMIMQEPKVSLNPVFPVGFQIAEAIAAQRKIGKRAARKEAVEMLRRVRIAEPDKVANQYPHELSGGMAQRAMIAMMLSTRPKLLIADEPTSALDVTTQAQILELLRDLVREVRASVLLITHDLGVVAEACERVAVMYAGRVVEEGSVRQVLKEARHPYTVGLLQTIPRPGDPREELTTIEGSVPDLIHPPSGCRFHPRCPEAMEICRLHIPAAVEVAPGHRVACHLYAETPGEE